MCNTREVDLAMFDLLDGRWDIELIRVNAEAQTRDERKYLVRQLLLKYSALMPLKVWDDEQM